MKKHPGIVFTWFGIETWILLALSLNGNNWFPWIVDRYILFAYGAMLFYFIVYLHGQWIEKLVRRYLETKDAKPNE
jgi:Kef-type K+ transport system membrane component KefB